MPEGIWIVDEVTGEPEFLPYSEMEESAVQTLIKPIGGFCWRAGEFLQLRLPPVPFYIQDWLPKQGKAMIYAPAKSGKSFLCMNIARCIGMGEPVLGMATNQGKVLYIQSELGAKVLQDRIKMTGQEYENVFIGTTFALKLDQTGGKNLLRNALEDVKPDVLILDPLYKLVSGDENESKDMRTIADFLDEVIEVYGCSILIIHHPGKDIKKGGRGSSVIEDWVDSAIEMRKTSKNGENLKVKLTPKLLRHASTPPEAIEAELIEFEFENCSDTNPTVRQQVEVILNNCSVPVPVKELMNNVNASNTAIYGALKRLMKDGKATQPARGFYKGR